MADIINKTRKQINAKNRMGELIRFALVGGMATAIQYGMYVVFALAVGVAATVATMISYAISFIFNFILSNYFTFHTKPNAGGGIGFTLSHLINMGLQVGFVAIFNLIVPKSIALLPAMALCIPINYMMVRYALTNDKLQRILTLRHPVSNASQKGKKQNKFVKENPK